MAIAEICNTDVVTIPSNTSIIEAAKLMRDKKVGSVVVIKTQGKNETPVGILTDRDIVNRIIAAKGSLEQSKVEDALSSDLLILEKNNGIKEAIDAMSAKKVRRAPVVDEEGKLCGIVSADDFFVLLSEELKSLGSLIGDQTVNS